MIILMDYILIISIILSFFLVTLMLPKWIRKFRDIPDRHVFQIAQIDRIEDAYSGISTFRPTMPGKYLIKKLPFWFDEVLCLRIGEMRKEDGSTEEYRYLQTQPDISYHAKDRSGKLNKIELEYKKLPAKSCRR